MPGIPASAESELIEAIRKSDNKAFKQFYYDYYEKLGQYIFNRIHSDGVEDAMCSTFVYRNGARGNLLAN